MPNEHRVKSGCWAEGISPCSDEPSKEHAISKGIAAALHPSIRAVSFTTGGLELRQTIGVNSLTLPILCKRHNGELSPTDTEAARFFSGLSRLTSRSLSDTGLMTTSGQAVLAVDGHLMERWAAKTFLNLVLAAVPHSTEQSPLLPITGRQIAEEVFTSKPFPGRQGLYGLPPGMNLMRLPAPEFHLSPMTMTIMSMDVRLYRQAMKKWTGPYRMPVFLYIAASGFEFLLHANLTAMSNGDFDPIVAPRWNDPAALTAVRHPQCTPFDLPQLDGPTGPFWRRVVMFTWV
jgi:hypothetical protein